MNNETENELWRRVELTFDARTRCLSCSYFKQWEEGRPYGSTVAYEPFEACSVLEDYKNPSLCPANAEPTCPRCDRPNFRVEIDGQGELSGGLCESCGRLSVYRCCQNWVWQNHEPWCKWRVPYVGTTARRA